MRKFIILVLIFAAAAIGAYEALTFIDDAFMPGRMRETPAVRPHEQPLLMMTEQGTIPFDGGEAVYRATPAQDLRSPLEQMDEETLKRGKILYFIYCVPCHGKYHDGNGTVGQSFHPLPTDLRSEKVQSQPEGALFKTISYGIAEGRQPPLATTIEAMDRWRIVTYLKSLGPRKMGNSDPERTQ